MPENKDSLNKRRLEAPLFAAANSGRGFVSFYENIFNAPNIVRRYLIKGGPGTGKSSFMRRVASFAEDNGYSVEYYRCSSDPSSLDGIIIDSRIAVIDSTAPHTVEPLLAGARDIILDFGSFWDTEALYAQRERIETLTEQKKRAYALAYRYLSSAIESDLASREILLPYVNKKRISKMAKRLLKGVEDNEGYSLKIGLTDSIGMQGRRSLDGYFLRAERVVYIEEHYGIAFLLISELCELAKARGSAISVSYDPLDPNIPNAVFFERSKLLFVVSKERRKGAISLRRALDLAYVSKGERNSLKAKSRFSSRVAESLVSSAVDALRSAGDAHFALEKIYGSAMDFSALDALYASVSEGILKIVEHRE